MNKTLKNTTLKILASQQNFTVGAIEKNAEKIITIIQDNQANHDLILFSELAITGYPPEDLLFRSQLHHRVNDALHQIAINTKDCYVIVGHPLLENDACYNAASILYQGHCVQVYRKQQLPNTGVFDEKRYFKPGPAKTCQFTVKGNKIGLCICEDIWHDETIKPFIHQHTDLLICINASPYDTSKYDQRINLLKKHAEQNLPIIYLNQLGGQDELIFDGQSLAFNSNGDLATRLPAFMEMNATLTFENHFITGPIAPLTNQEANIYHALVLGTQDYIQKNKFSGVLIGLSGGVDSALTLAIAVDALGPEKVHAVMMPSRYTADISLEDAKKQAETLRVKYTVIPIEESVQAIQHTLADPFQDLTIKGVVEENVQARIRGVLLMAMSNQTGYMVLTTSNKSETAVGYATLYGDMVGGYAVLKDVLKTQVYALAHYRNLQSHVIPERVLTRAPTAELREQQTDQDSLPPYPILDAIIQAYIEDNADAPELIKQGFSAEIVDKVIHLIKHNEYKRRQAAPGPKISHRAFTRDRRYPISNHY